MNAGVVIALGLVAIVVLTVVVFLTAARKADVRGAGALSTETKSRDRSVEGMSSQGGTAKEVELAASSAARGGLVKASSLPPAPWSPPDPDVIGVSRRQFFNRTLITLMAVSLGSFGAACIGFLWPKSGGSFGSKIAVGKLDDVLSKIDSEGGFAYYPEARTWITKYPAASLPKARKAYQTALIPGMEAGIVALYQKCPHLGCRVPECKTSQWFECPCHGSQYNRVGEKKGGPAPRGMDRFTIEVKNGNVAVDTGARFDGPAIGTNTTGQEAEGPNCVGASEGGGH
jgi:cytochrome b6-f complex iron-sulfur subunit